MEADEVITVSDLRVTLAGHEVVRGLSFNVRRGEIVGLVGASGSGKTVLLRTMLGLLPKTSGTVEIMGVRLEQATPAESRRIGGRCGMMFQQGALFSSLTLRENVEFPMREYLDGSDAMYGDVALAKLAMVGLGVEDADKLPSEISGGMTKRVAIARALALDPDILFLDEPTSGLDPIAAGEIDRLIRTLQRVLNLTVFMVTHDLNSLKSVCTRILALYDGRITRGCAPISGASGAGRRNWHRSPHGAARPLYRRRPLRPAHGACGAGLHPVDPEQGQLARAQRTHRAFRERGAGSAHGGACDLQRRARGRGAAPRLRHDQSERRRRPSGHRPRRPHHRRHASHAGGAGVAGGGLCVAGGGAIWRGLWTGPRARP